VQRGGGHRGHKAKRKKKEKENKIEEGSSHRSSLARRPVILRVARAQHPSLRRARPPLRVSHSFAQFVCFEIFLIVFTFTKYFDWGFFYYFLVTKEI
jgi:hypothetical protein